MRARLIHRLADTWWHLFRRPAPWTRRERRDAVRFAEEWLHAQHAAASSRRTRRGAGLR